MLALKLLDEFLGAGGQWDVFGWGGLLVGDRGVDGMGR